MALAETGSKIDHLTDDERECIGICTEAVAVREWCGDECARLCRDVADIASLHARFMARDSTDSTQLAEACADACEECAGECERYEAVIARSVPRFSRNAPRAVGT